MDKQPPAGDDMSVLKAMVAQQSKQLSEQNKQIQNLKRGRNGNPKGCANGKKPGPTDVQTCNTGGRQYSGECIKNSYLDNELQEVNKAVSKLKNLQLIKQQSEKTDKTSGTGKKG
eukprot:97484-Rhodomonas_salina.1